MTRTDPSGPVRPCRAEQVHEPLLDCPAVPVRVLRLDEQVQGASRFDRRGDQAVEGEHARAVGAVRTRVPGAEVQFGELIQGRRADLAPAVAGPVEPPIVDAHRDARPGSVVRRTPARRHPRRWRAGTPPGCAPAAQRRSHDGRRPAGTAKPDQCEGWGLLVDRPPPHQRPAIGGRSRDQMTRGARPSSLTRGRPAASQAHIPPSRFHTRSRPWAWR